MNKNKLLIAVFIVVVSMFVYPQDRACLMAQSSNELKISVVDYNKVFYDYSLTVTQFIQLTNEKENLQKYVTNTQKEIENRKNVYKEQEELYDEERKREELLKIWTLMLELELKVKEETKQIKMAEEELIKQIDQRITAAVEKARKELGYDIVLNKGSVFSVGDDIDDITEYVINILLK